MSSSLVPVVVVQSLSCVWFYMAPWTATHQASLSFTISQHLLNSRSWSQWCHSTISSSVIPFSSWLQCPSIRVFFNEPALQILWPKYWSFSTSASPSNECSDLILFRIDWLDLLAVHGTLKSFFQHHSWKASVLQCSFFFLVQLSHPYMTIGKALALSRQNFVGKVMSLLFFHGTGVL